MVTCYKCNSNVRHFKMTDDTHSLLGSAIRGRYSSLKHTLTEEHVYSIWDNVATFVEKQMAQMKGVHIPGLGVFSICQKKIEVGNNRIIISQRPVFNVSEKFAHIHGLQYQKYHIPGTVPALPLNFASVSFESPFDRDTVERCVKEIVRTTSLAVAAKRNVELCFAGIGRLVIREGRIKMKFYKEFVNAMDSSGKVVESLMNRAGTVDSVMSERPSIRPHSSSTVVLPKIQSSQNGGNTPIFGNITPVQEEKPAEDAEQLPDSCRDSLHLPPEMESPSDGAGTAVVPDDHVFTPRTMEGTGIDPATEQAIENILQEGGVVCANNQPITVPGHNKQKTVTLESRCRGRAGSQMALPISKADVISLFDETLKPPTSHKPCLSAQTIRTSRNEAEHAGLQHPVAPKLFPVERSRSFDSRLNDSSANYNAPTPPRSACEHPFAGQELCYLCHQRAKRNVPVSFAKELKRREEEEDRLLQQYQIMKDAEETLKDQEHHWARRNDLQKIAAFNLGVAEAVHTKNKLKDTEPQRAFVFSRRPLTPSQVFVQEEYLRDLNKQVDTNEKTRQKRKADDDFLERLEQIQLADDLAAQREMNLKQKMESTEAYRKALDAQVKFRPPTLPDKEPDGEFFGKHDMNSDKMAERRQKAYSLLQEQKSFVEQKKRDAILARLAEQKQEEEMLKRAKDDLNDDRAFKHMLRFETRKHLESDWQNMKKGKKALELTDRLRSLSPGILVHEQCDQYQCCRQCKRRLQNCGESNIWRESRYIPGTRIMV